MKKIVISLSAFLILCTCLAHEYILLPAKFYVSLPALALTARTDATGVCTFRLPKEGDWFLHATHMIACADQTDSDWESFWASYSFGIKK